jgi:hypothetical protein
MKTYTQLEIIEKVLLKLRAEARDSKYLFEAINMIAPLLLKELKIMEMKEEVNLLNKQNENNKNK